MLFVVYILLFFSLLMVFFQDCKSREVHVAYFAGILVSSSLFLYNKGILLSTLIMNLFFLIINLLALGIYMRFKKGTIKGFLNNGVALGDIVFLVVIIPLFSFLNYALFYIIGMCFSLTIHIVVKKMKLDERETVPLAGYLSLFLIIILVLSNVLCISLYDNKIFL